MEIMPHNVYVIMPSILRQGHAGKGCAGHELTRQPGLRNAFWAESLLVCGKSLRGLRTGYLGRDGHIIRALLLCPDPASFGMGVSLA
jgi:hypothetical protein